MKLVIIEPLGVNDEKLLSMAKAFSYRALCRECSR